MTPKIIHHIVGPDTNKVVERCLNSWLVLEPHGFEIKVWTDQTLELFLQAHYPFISEVFLNARNHAERADIGRYILVYHFGGHYFDWDIQLLIPELFFKLINENPNGYVLRDPNGGSLASEAFAASKNEQFLLFLIEEIVDIFHTSDPLELGTLAYTGPFRMRDSFRRFGKSMQTVLEVKDVFLYDYHEIKDLPEREVNRPMIHYWLHSWLPENLAIKENQIMASL